MCKKLMLLSCLVTLLGLSNIAFAAELFEIFKVDFSCPNDQASKKGGDWLDFVLIDGCDYENKGAKDGQWGLIDAGGTDIEIEVGSWAGHGNVISREFAEPIWDGTGRAGSQ
ncbi:MAG: hypothetical protein ACYS21_17130 [Planctomycetota bacterium]|jgi:hypothetical protein